MRILRNVSDDNSQISKKVILVSSYSRLEYGQYRRYYVAIYSFLSFTLSVPHR